MEALGEQQRIALRIRGAEVTDIEIEKRGESHFVDITFKPIFSSSDADTRPTAQR